MNQYQTNETPFQQGLKKFLARKGLTQTALSRKVYMSDSRVNQWVHGRGADPSITLALLALEGMTLEEMFGNEIVEKLVANSRDCSNEVVRKVAETIAPKPKAPTREEKRKSGFITKLASLFSAKR